MLLQLTKFFRNFRAHETNMRTENLFVLLALVTVPLIVILVLSTFCTIILTILKKAGI